MTEQNVALPNNNFVALERDVAYHTATGLIVSLVRRVVAVPTGRFRLDYPKAHELLQSPGKDISIYNRLFATADAQNFISVSDNGLSDALETVTVSICGTCQKYCNTSLRGHGFKEHVKLNPECAAKNFSMIKKQGLRLYMAKKKCVFILLSESSSRSPSPAPEQVLTPRVIGQQGLNTNFGKAISQPSPPPPPPSGAIEDSLAIANPVVSPTLSYNFTTDSSRPSYFTSNTTTDSTTTLPSPNPTALTQVSNKGATTTTNTSRKRPFSYTAKDIDYPSATSTPKSTKSRSRPPAVVDSSNEASPLPYATAAAAVAAAAAPPPPPPPEKTSFRVPGNLPFKSSISKSTTHGIPSSNINQRAKTTTLPSVTTLAPTSALNFTPNHSHRNLQPGDHLGEARSRLQIPVTTTATTATSSSINNNLNFSEIYPHPPTRPTSSLDGLGFHREKDGGVGMRSITAAPGKSLTTTTTTATTTFNGMNDYTSTDPFPTPVRSFTHGLYQHPTIQPRLMSVPEQRHVDNSTTTLDLLDNVKWHLQQALLREVQVLNNPISPYVSKLITPGSMENKMVAPTLLLQCILSRIRPTDGEGRYASVTGPWALSIVDGASGVQIDLLVRPLSHGVDDQWSVQIKLIVKSAETNMITSNELQWNPVEFGNVCVKVLAFTALIKEMFTNPLSNDAYQLLKLGIPRLGKVVEQNNRVSAVDVVKGWLNDTMQTTNPRCVTLAGAPLG